jgi:hypothetical protein
VRDGGSVLAGPAAPDVDGDRPTYRDAHRRARPRPPDTERGAYPARRGATARRTRVHHRTRATARRSHTTGMLGLSPARIVVIEIDGAIELAISRWQTTAPGHQPADSWRPVKGNPKRSVRCRSPGSSRCPSLVLQLRAETMHAECQVCPLRWVTRTQWMWCWCRHGDTNTTSMQPDKVDRARNVRNVEPSAEQRRGRAGTPPVRERNAVVVHRCRMGYSQLSCGEFGDGHRRPGPVPPAWQCARSVTGCNRAAPVR